MTFRTNPLVLASASPRRLALLDQIGISPDQVLATDIDETPHRGELPAGYARRMAREKAAAQIEKELLESGKRGMWYTERKSYI